MGLRGVCKIRFCVSGVFCAGNGFRRKDPNRGGGVGLKVGFGGMFINWIWDEKVSEQEGLGKVEFREWA